MAPAASHLQPQGLDPGLPSFSEGIYTQEDTWEKGSIEGWNDGLLVPKQLLSQKQIHDASKRHPE